MISASDRCSHTSCDDHADGYDNRTEGNGVPMTYSLTWLPQVLRNAGLKVQEQPGWKTRGHGDADPTKGVICHHTNGAKSGNMPTLNVLINGRPDLKGPLSQLGLGRDGTYYVIAAGLCWHAGPGSWQGLTNGNSSFIGIEAENVGDSSDPWPTAQMDAYRRGVAAILKHIKAPSIMCCGHKEWAPSRKDDPSFNMTVFRQMVAALLVEVPLPPRPPAKPSLFYASGRISTFGGPGDTGMSPIEGLALFETSDEMKHYLGADWVLSPALAGASGLGRRLNPRKLYVACRWDYAKTSKKFLKSAVALVEANGKTIAMRPVDWGPNIKTGRVADLSPEGAIALGLRTDDECTVTIAGDIPPPPTVPIVVSTGIGAVLGATLAWFGAHPLLIAGVFVGATIGIYFIVKKMRGD